MQQAPTSTVQRIHNEAIPVRCERSYGRIWEETKEAGDLVLGVDDFAIKKVIRIAPVFTILKAKQCLNDMVKSILENFNMFKKCKLKQI